MKQPNDSSQLFKTTCLSRPGYLAATGGFFWGLIAAILLGNAQLWGPVSDLRWLSLVIGPFIGILVWKCSRWSYSRGEALRIGWAFLSLFGAAALHMGVLGVIVVLATETHGWAAIVEITLASLWGLIFFPLLWPLYILSYVHHAVIRRMTLEPMPT